MNQGIPNRFMPEEGSGILSEARNAFQGNDGMLPVPAVVETMAQISCLSQHEKDAAKVTRHLHVLGMQNLPQHQIK
eukprot:6475210-Amphidinium_carterae.1